MTTFDATMLSASLFALFGLMWMKKSRWLDDRDDLDDEEKAAALDAVERARRDHPSNQ